MQADLGGTEILPPLRAVLRASPVPAHARQVFVLTDGEVWNVDEIVQEVQLHQHHSRVFALGLGSGASHEVVNGIGSHFIA